MLNNVLQFFYNLFNTFWSLVKDLLNGGLGFVETVINAAIKGLNKTFEFINGHSIDIPHRRGGAVRVCFTTPVIVDELFSSITPKNAKTEAQLKEAN